MMRHLSTISCASAVAFGAVALSADGAVASINYNASKSNTFSALNIKDPKAVQACTDAGGTVGKDPKGQDACVKPAPASAAAPATAPAPH